MSMRTWLIYAAVIFTACFLWAPVIPTWAAIVLTALAIVGVVVGSRYRIEIER